MPIPVFAETLWRDARYAARTLARNPGFTAAAVAALALGMGADTAMFTIVRGALTWNLGLDRVDRVVLVTASDAAHSQVFGASYPDFRDFRARAKTLSGLAAYRLTPVNVSDASGLPERYDCAEMSAGGFRAIGQTPQMGRGFVDADEQPGAPRVLVIAHHVWQQRYGGDPAILGKTVRVNEVPMAVIGVMPAGRRFPEDTDLWTPLVPNAALERREQRGLMVFGRLADGVPVSSARAEFDTLARQLAAQYPATNRGLTADVRPVAEITGVYSMRPLFAALLVAVGFVLLIACADVANMLLAQATSRAREISIRTAIGAGRGRIVRQLLMESLALSAAAACFGWFVAWGGLRWFDAGIGAAVNRPLWLNLSLDRGAFAYLAAVSVAAAILFGLAPALRLAGTDIQAALKDGGYGTVSARRTQRLSRLLVVTEMALCVVLLVGAGLLIRSAVNLYGAPLGVNPANVLTMRINLPEAKYPRPEDQVLFHDALRRRLETLPGVEAATVASNLPLGAWMSFPYEREGAPAAGRPPRLSAIVAGARYFALMQVRPRRGRLFVDSDGRAGIPVAVVNESFANKLWPGQDPLGRRLRLLDAGGPQPWLTVVGVVPDILQNFRRLLEHEPLVYLPFPALPQRQVFLAARTRVRPTRWRRPFAARCSAWMATCRSTRFAPWKLALPKAG